MTQAVYNVSGGRPDHGRRNPRLLDERLPGSRYDIGSGFLPDWDRQGPYDLSASTRDLGYTPAWTLERGLDSQIDWLRSQGGAK